MRGMELHLRLQSLSGHVSSDPSFRLQPEIVLETTVRVARTFPPIAAHGQASRVRDERLRMFMAVTIATAARVDN
ncbi:hypothetical protein SVAN01_04022 [Stagonosporopsis vannaccii]|nr:hypothetical protein SVAN01_04022 [Stagonosporopsis vannaccii]